MRRAVPAVVLALSLAGCGGSAKSDDGGGAPAGVQQVRVLADESLRTALDTIGTRFEEQNPQAEVVLAYGEAMELARRIAGGEPAEVFVTEDPAAMATVTGFDKTVGEPETFTGGLLRIVAVSDTGAPFVTFVTEGDGFRVLSETGVLRP
jgi:ABC-type molybdate transport system substrate-binding protein